MMQSTPRSFLGKPASESTERTRAVKDTHAVGARFGASGSFSFFSFLGDLPAPAAEGLAETRPSRVEMRPLRVFISERSWVSTVETLVEDILVLGYLETGGKCNLF